MTKIEAKSVYDCYGKLVTALLPPYYGIRHLCRNAVKMATLFECVSSLLNALQLQRGTLNEVAD